MATLQFSQTDLIKVRSQWAEVMAKTKYLGEDVVGDMFAHLLADNPSLKPEFSSPNVLQEQQLLFSELIKCAMMYMNEQSILDECLQGFVRESPQIVEMGSKYLVPMCSAMIKTLRNTLTATSFHPEVERLWIQVYQYVTNFVLQTSDAFSAAGGVDEKEDEEEEEEEILPLNIKRPEMEVKSASLEKDESKEGEYISVFLSDNLKYKGFRRSISESPQAPLLIKIPESFKSPSKNKFGLERKSSFDNSPQRDLSVNYHTRTPLVQSFTEDPQLTPRCSRRNTTIQLQKLGLGVDSNGYLYDPRGKSLQRKKPDDLNVNLNFLFPEFLGENYKLDKFGTSLSNNSDDSLGEHAIDFTQQSTTRVPVFEPNSFGIKGLAPIEEFDHDNELSDSNTSSNYEATIDKSSDDDTTSRTSSLSLHRLGYKSSISSESGLSGYNKSPTLASARMKDDFVPQMDPPKPMFVMQNSAFLNSLPIINPRMSSGQRASAGFMKSSFILKKDMINEKGYKVAESASLYADIPTGYMPKCQSLTNLPRWKPLPTNSVTNLEAPTQSTISSSGGKENKRDSFFKRLGMRFMSNSSKPSTQQPVISQTMTPRETKATETPSHDYMSTRSGVSGHTNPYNVSNNTFKSSHRVSSLDVRLKPADLEPRGYAGSIYLNPYVTNNASTISFASNKSGKKYLFFRRGSKLSMNDSARKENKYRVNSTPYKTIYVKDLVG